MDCSRLCWQSRRILGILFMWNTESGLGGVNMLLADLKRDIEVLGERIEDLRVSL